MITSRQKSTGVPGGAIARKQKEPSCPEGKNPVGQGRIRLISAAIVLLILGIDLALSVKCDFLFFKEWLLSGSIIGMCFLLKTFRHPAITLSRGNHNRANLN